MSDESLGTGTDTGMNTSIHTDTGTSAHTDTDTGADTLNWPLHKISELHPTNDVLWTDGLLEETTAQMMSEGNQRFRELLLAHCQEYHDRAKMEKPLVALKILRHWREGQSPPGRFLVVETDTHPPLYKDMGDKKARAKISKALKQLCSDIAKDKEEKSGLNNQEDTTTCRVSYPVLLQDTGRKKYCEDHQEDPSYHSSPLVTNGNSGRASSHLLHVTTPLEQERRESHSAHHHLLEYQQANRAKSLGQPPSKFPDLPATNNNHPNKPLLSPPVMPKFRRENFERRITEQLHTAQAQGRLYGRWKERDQLVAICRQQQKRNQCSRMKDEDQDQEKSPISVISTAVNTTSAVPLVLISGCLGVGKTSLARTLRHSLPSDRHPHDKEEVQCDPFHDDDDFGTNADADADDIITPFFLEGKFELCKWEDPNAVFVSVIADFCHQLSNQCKERIKLYRQAIAQYLPDDIAILENLVPSLRPLLKRSGSTTTGTTTPWQEESVTNSSDDPSSRREDSSVVMAMQRIKQAFVDFFRTIAAVSPYHNPVIILLDDLHWASEPAMEILQFIVTELETSDILFLGTYRIEETEPHFTKTVKQIKADHRAVVRDILLENLQEENVTFMLSDALALSAQETRKLKDLIFPVTKGNPTFVKELLRIFQEREMIRFDGVSMTWVCDFEQIPQTLDAIQSVPDLFKAKIQSLPPSAQETLKIAACLISTQIDEEILKMIDTVGAVSAHLKLADILGLLQYRDGQYWFASDSIKQAVVDLIAEKDHASYHLKIGQRMWLHLKENQNASFYANLTYQMFMSDHLVVEEQDRRSLAMFYLESGQGAMCNLGSQTAGYCLARGIKMMQPLKKWGRDNYDLSLSLYNMAIEVFYCNADFDELDSLIAEVLDNARTFDDSLLARSTKIYSLGSRHHHLEAIQLGLDTLKEIDLQFPSIKPHPFRVLLEGRRLRRMLRGMSDEKLLALPRMKDPKKVAAMQIMTHFLLYTIMASPSLSALMIFRMVELTIKHGLTGMASVAFVMYGFILSSRYGAIDDGIRFGKLSLRICDRFKKGVWLNRSNMCFYGFIYPRKYPVKGCLGPLRDAHRLGMRNGDIEFATLSACMVCWEGAEVTHLAETESNILQVLRDVDFYGQAQSMAMIKPMLLCTHYLMGVVSWSPKAAIKDGMDGIEQASDKKDRHLLIWYRYCGMKMSYLFSDFDLAEEFSDTASEIYLYNDTGGMDAAEALLYECMVLLAQVQRGKRGRFGTLRYVRRRLKKLKFWAEHSPSNFLGKQYLLEAEIATAAGNNQKAQARYRSAILHSREGSFYLEEALANELLGKLYLKENDAESAVPLLEEARRVYESWGARGKVEHFDKEHGEFLTLSLR